MIIGTSYFPDFLSACQYYKPYGYKNVKKAVERKIAEGEIHIGKPKAGKGEKVFLYGKEMRYFVETLNQNIKE